MEKVLTGLELKVVIKEIQSLLGAHLNKIYQPESKTLLLGFRKEGSKVMVKVDSGVGVYITSHEYKTQKVPPSFCMFLRKHLMNSKLKAVSQKNVERVVEFKFDSRGDSRILVCELFGNGNFILCNKDYIILNLAVNKTFKGRTLKKGEKYEYPPERFNLLKLNQEFFAGALESWKDHDVVKMIASGLGFGGTYAEEICLRSKVDKNKVCSQLTKEESNEIYEQVQKIITEFDKSKAGFLFEVEGNPSDASPLKLELPDTEVKQVASFNEAVDVLLASAKGKEVRKEKSALFEKKLEKLEQRLEIQQRSLKEYKETWKKNQRIADEIYEKYQLVSNILEKVSNARRLNYSWVEIDSVLAQEKRQGIQEALSIKRIIPEENKIVVDIAGGIDLDLSKTISQNAEAYYGKAKTSKAKIEGAEKIVVQTERDIKNLMSKREEVEEEIEKSVPKAVEIVKKDWFEKFHWFRTSSGLLAIGGRDATQNDILIKKHMEISDQVFHTEDPGSPFFILKEGRDKGEGKDREEVAIATASFSKAWSAGRTSTDVYWVKPEQVTKEAKSGEYLTKGAFMIRGKRNWLRNTALQISIGVDKENHIFAGPRSAVSKHAVKYISVRHGSEKKSDVAKKVVKNLETTKLDDVMQALPAGTFSLVT